MAGGQQTLKTIVVLSGRVDNSFGIIGSELTQLGNKVNGVSSQLAQYGEESLNVYKNYEDGILETRSVLARQYSSSGELNKAMSSLEEHAQAWASTTIFHTNDVASAMATGGACRMGLRQDHLRPPRFDAHCAGRRHGADRQRGHALQNDGEHRHVV